MADLGTDFSCIDDITPDLALVSDLDCLEQSLVRELAGSPGDLFYDDEWGGGMFDFVNSVGVSAWAVASEAERICSRDERVETVSAEATVEEDGTVTARIVGETAEGPFDLIATIGTEGVIARIVGG